MRKNTVGFVLIFVFILPISIHAQEAEGGNPEQELEFQQRLRAAHRFLQETKNGILDGSIPPLPIGEVAQRGRSNADKMLLSLQPNIIPTPSYLSRLFKSIYEARGKDEPQVFGFRIFVCKRCLEEAGGAASFGDGTIFISKELLMTFENEAELAGVLAHEMTHDSEEHLGKHNAFFIYILNHGNNLPIQRALEEEPETNTINYEFERRADIGALRTMRKLGYNPCAYARYSEKSFSPEDPRIPMLKKETQGICEGALFKIGTQEELKTLQLYLREIELINEIMDLT